MAKRKADYSPERPREPPIFEQVARKSKLLAAFMDTETKAVAEDNPDANYDSDDTLHVNMFAPPKFYTDAEIDAISKQQDVIGQNMADGATDFMEAVKITNPKTGKAKFINPTSSSSSGESKKATLADDSGLDNMRYDVTFHLSDSGWETVDHQGLYVQEGLEFLRTYYEAYIMQYNPNTVWVIDTGAQLGYLRKLIKSARKQEGESSQTHVMMNMFMDYATGNREFVSPDHFWLFLYDIVINIREALETLKTEVEEAEYWSAASIIETYSELYKKIKEDGEAIQTGASFMEYMTRWLLATNSPMHNKEFVQNVRRRILNPLIERAIWYFKANSVSILGFALPKRKKMLASWEGKKDETAQMLALVRFFLQPSRATAEAINSLPESMITRASLQQEAKFSASDFFALNMFKAAHSPDEKDWIPFQNAKTVEGLLGTAPTHILFNAYSNGVLFFKTETINALLIFMLLAHPEWRKHGQVAFVGDRSNARFEKLFKEGIVIENRDRYRVRVPDGAVVVPLDFDNLSTNLKTNQLFYEWLIKKHPSYRRKQVDAFLFETPLGQIRPWVERGSLDGRPYVGKGEKATYQVVPKKGFDRPLGDKFDIRKETKEETTEDGSKRLKVSIPVPKELPTDIYQLISEFYTKGKVIDQAWCERNDQDTDIREYLFPGYWRLLHYAAFIALLAKDIAFAKRLVQFVAEVLPCDNCKGHFNEQLEAAEVPLASMTGPQLQQFLVEAHNKVNKENGKPVLSLSQARAVSSQTSDADLPGFWDLLHRRAARVKFSWDRADLIQLARLITELTLGLHPTWYRKLVRDLEQVQDIRDMFEMTVRVHNKLNKKYKPGTCHMELDKARLVYS